MKRALAPFPLKFSEKSISGKKEAQGPMARLQEMRKTLLEGALVTGITGQDGFAPKGRCILPLRSAAGLGVDWNDYHESAFCHCQDSEQVCHFPGPAACQSGHST
jgi:hypothetical protein